MASKSVEAGKAFLKLTVEDSEFRRGLDNSLRKLDSFGQAITGIGLKLGAAGAAITAPFAAAIKTFADAGSELFDLAASTSVSVEQLSFLKYAAEQSGAGLTQIAQAARAMQGQGLDPRKFEEVALKIAGIEDPTKRAQAAFDAFGKRAGFLLLPMLRDLEALKMRFEELGGVMSSKSAAAADKLGDAFNDVKVVLLSIGNQVAEVLGPEVLKLTDYLVSNTKAIKEFVAENSRLVTILATGGVGMTVASGFMTSLGVSITILTGLIHGLVAAIGFLLALSPTTWIIAITVATVAGAAAWHTYEDSVYAANAALKKQKELLEDNQALWTGQPEWIRRGAGSGATQNSSTNVPLPPANQRNFFRGGPGQPPNFPPPNKGGAILLPSFEVLDRDFLAKLNTDFPKKLGDTFGRSLIGGRFAEQVFGGGGANLGRDQLMEQRKALKELEKANRRWENLHRSNALFRFGAD